MQSIRVWTIGVVTGAFLLCLLPGAQAQNVRIRKKDSLAVEAFARDHKLRRSLEFRFVYEEARQVFRPGQFVHLSQLDSLFAKTLYYHPQSKAEQEGMRFTLFRGSDGITGKDVILTVDEEGRVQGLEIRSFGR